MIELGEAFSPGSPSTCPNDSGVVIEHLGLTNAGTGTVNGIYNNDAQELNYVTDVALSGITGTGLRIVGTNNLASGTTVNGCANNSGPYTNIYFSGSGTCVNINGTNSTRGIHGLNCVGTGTTTAAAILLDSRNSTIQNVSISGTYATGADGILIGSQLNTFTNNFNVPVGSYAQNDLLMNITGSSSLKNVVHIKTNTTGTLPSDLTFMGISGGGTNSIKDDVAGSGSKTSTSPVSLYVLGEGIGTGNSRFTTSTTVPAWFVGASVPVKGQSCPSGIVTGSLYSITNNSNSPSITLWDCTGGVWDSVK
jgi:hypothetical protein